jgi:hypothetical protein
MEDQIVWLSPLLILPGVCLLIVSTSARYGELHSELHHWLDGTDNAAVIAMTHLLQRARLFRNSLVSLYLCVFIFALASLTGAVLQFIGLPHDFAVFVISFLGVGCLGFAAFSLIRESLLSLAVIQAHVRAAQKSPQ